MRTRLTVAAGSILAASAWAQTASPIEPPNFNVPDALLDSGVDVSKIPALADIVETSVPNACSRACASLETVFGTKLITQEKPEYDAFTGAYWSQQQAEVNPACIFKPAKAADISVMILISRLTQCPFAVKSGGHAAFRGASNIPGGITVALEKMKGLKLSADKKIVAVETGNLWYDVYTTLKQDDLAVIGGRVAPIGSGGLTLGGGISYFSNKYGWACDNVISFEVVTASGLTVTASPTSFPDLYWALRGGGNNFGIVTKLNMETIPVGQMWGGAYTFVEQQFPDAIKAFVNMGINQAQDTDAAQIFSFVHARGRKFANAELEYAKPISNAFFFSEWLSIPVAQDTSGIKSLSELTIAMNASNPYGLRESYNTATFKLDEGLVTFIKNVFYEEIEPIKEKVVVAAGSLQVLSVPMLERSKRNGGNPLGLNSADGPLLLLNPSLMWMDMADDACMLQANGNIIKRAVEEAKRRRLDVDYIYMNYAGPSQQVIASYGAENVQKLNKVAAKYDPTGVFQKLQPGFFKLP